MSAFYRDTVWLAPDLEEKPGRWPDGQGKVPFRRCGVCDNRVSGVCLMVGGSIFLNRWRL